RPRSHPAAAGDGPLSTRRLSIIQRRLCDRDDGWHDEHGDHDDDLMSPGQGKIRGHPSFLMITAGTGETLLVVLGRELHLSIANHVVLNPELCLVRLDELFETLT